MMKIKNIHHLKAVLGRGEYCFMAMLPSFGLSHPYIYYREGKFRVSYDRDAEGVGYSEGALLGDNVVGRALQSGKLYVKD